MAGGTPWDAEDYSKMYQNFKDRRQTNAVQYPYCKRIGLPALASRLDMPPEKSFLYINLLSGLVTTIVLFVALIRRFPIGVSWFCIVPTLVYMSSPFRSSNFLPFEVDPPALALYAIATLLYSSGFKAWSVLILYLSCLFREAGVYFAVAFSFAAVLDCDPGVKKRTLISMLLLAAIFLPAVGLIGNYYNCHGSQLRTALYTAYMHLTDPLSVIRILAAISLTLGPMAVVWCSGIRNPLPSAVLWRCPFFLSFCLAILMSVAGGSDVTRIFYGAYPLYAFFLAGQIRDIGWKEGILLTAAGLVANRAVQKIPEPLNYWPNSDITGYFSFLPEYSHIGTASGILVFWCACYFVTKSIVNVGRGNASSAQITSLLGEKGQSSER